MALVNPGITGIVAPGQIPYTNLTHRSAPSVELGSNNLWWAAVEARLGVGTNGAVPSAKIHVVGDGAPSARPLAMRVDGTAAARGEVFYGDISLSTYATEEVVYEICTPARASTRSRGYRYAGGAQTLVSGGELVDVNMTPANVQFGTGTILAQQRAVNIDGPTYSASSAKTISSAYTLYVAAPVKGTNVTWGTLGAASDLYAVRCHGPGGFRTHVGQVNGYLPGSAYYACYTVASLINLPTTTEYSAVQIYPELGGSTITWSGGSAPPIQRWIYFGAPTYGPGAIGTAATLYVEPGSSNGGTITNNWAIWSTGSVRIDGSLSAGSTGPATLTVSSSNRRIGVNSATPDRVVDFRGDFAGGVAGGITNTNNTGFSAWNYRDDGVVSKCNAGYGNASVSDSRAGMSYWSLSSVDHAFFDGGTIYLLYIDRANIRVGIGNTATINATLQVTQKVATTGSPIGLLLTGAAHTTLSNAESVDASFALARTVQFGQNTTLALQRAVLITAPTYASSAATKTITVAASFAVSGAPVVGTNVAITDAYAAIFGAKIRVDSAVALGAGGAATLGTTGGSGPATAAQNEWIAIDTQNGRRWVPAWA